MASGVSRFIRGKQPDKDLILDKIDQQKRKANEAHEQDKASIKMLLDRERKQAAQIQEQREEMDVLHLQRAPALGLSSAASRRAGPYWSWEGRGSSCRSESPCRASWRRHLAARAAPC